MLYERRLSSDELAFLTIEKPEYWLPRPSKVTWWMNRLGWTIPKTKRILRGLQGIIGIVEKNGHYNQFQHYYFVSKQMHQRVQHALDSEHPELHIEVTNEHALAVLKYLHARTRELKETYRMSFSPRFYRTEILKQTKITPKQFERNIDKLEGIVASTLTQKLVHDFAKPFSGPALKCAYFERKWFLPYDNMLRLEEQRSADYRLPVRQSS